MYEDDDLEIIDASLATKITERLRESNLTPKRRCVMDRIKESLAAGLGSVKIPQNIYLDVGPSGATTLQESDYSYFESLGYTVSRPVERASTDATLEDDDDLVFTTSSGVAPTFRTRAEIRWAADPEVEVPPGNEVL